MTEAERQPVAVDGQVYQVPVGSRHCVQGAPTSPGLCNAVLMKLDRRLAGLAKRYGFAYTRYADDLTFSGDDQTKVLKLMHVCRQIVREEGFEANHAKSRIARQGGRQVVTGVTVNKTLGLSRKERRKLRAAVHQASKANEPRSPRLNGKLAYLHMLNAEQGRAIVRSGSGPSQQHLPPT
jgi:retron-type reverse transcriptase